jgi:hypothetical protein
VGINCRATVHPAEIASKLSLNDIQTIAFTLNLIQSVDSQPQSGRVRRTETLGPIENGLVFEFLWKPCLSAFEWISLLRMPNRAVAHFTNIFARFCGSKCHDCDALVYALSDFQSLVSL